MGKIFIGKNKLNLIKTREPDPTIIYIGESAIDRPQTMGIYTTVNKDNPANASGKIDSVQIWCLYPLIDCKVATFFVVSGNYLSTRDYQAIGNVAAGSKQTISGLDIEVQIGDYIGVCYTDGSIDRSWTGYIGHWYTAPNKIPCVNMEFSFFANCVISLCGTGYSIPPPPAEASRTGIYTFKTLK